MKDIIFPITYKSDPKGINDAARDLSGLGNVAEGITAKIAGIGIAAGVAAGAAGVGLLAVTLTKGFDRLTSIENATNKLEGLGNSAETVEAVMDSALAAVKGTAYGLGDAANIAASAVAAGVKPGEELTKYLTLTADAASIAGVSLEEMGTTLNNVRTVGAAYNDSLQIVAQKGIPIYQMLADQLGITTGEVKDLASEGGISADMFEKAMTDKFGGAALKAGDTVQGSMENMGAALGRLGAALLGVTFEELPGKIEELTAGFDELLPQFQDFGERLAPIVTAAFEFLKDAASFFMDAITNISDWFAEHPGMFEAMGAAIMFIAAAIGIASVAFTIFNFIVALNPLVLIIGLIIAAIALLIAAIVLIAINWDQICKDMAKMWDWLSFTVATLWTGMINGIIDGINTVIGLINQVTGADLSLVAKLGAVYQPMSTRSGEGMTGGRGLKLAAGGIIPAMPNGTMATIGEAGPEAVIPLDRLDRMMGSGGAGNSITINVNAGMGADGAALGEQIVTAIRKYERTSGAVFAKA